MNRQQNRTPVFIHFNSLLFPYSHVTSEAQGFNLIETTPTPRRCPVCLRDFGRGTYGSSPGLKGTLMCVSCQAESHFTYIKNCPGQCQSRAKVTCCRGCPCSPLPFHKGHCATLTKANWTQDPSNQNCYRDINSSQLKQIHKTVCINSVLGLNKHQSQ